MAWPQRGPKSLIKVLDNCVKFTKDIHPRILFVFDMVGDEIIFSFGAVVINSFSFYENYTQNPTSYPSRFPMIFAFSALL